jgi:predicted MFS family arabinose efflux permease
VTRAVLRDAAFVQYLSATFVLHTSAMVVGPFFAVYLVRELQAQPGQVGLLATVEAGGAVLGQFVLGFFIARSATAKVFRRLLLSMPVVPLLWLLPRIWWHAALPNVVGGAAWAVHNVLAFNLLMEHAPTDNLPRYAAAQQTVVLTASFVGPALGTWVVANYDIRAAIVASAVGRLLAALVLVMPFPSGSREEPSTAG